MLNNPPELRTVIEALKDLMRWLTVEKIRGTIIGGVAASLLGQARLTRDVDALVLVDDSDWERLVASAANYGIAPRVDDVLEFAARTRVLLFRHVASGIGIDVLLGGVAFDREVIARSSLIAVGRFQVRIPAPEDLVTMKAVARRGRDIVDIESIMDVHRDLDINYIRRWLREFSSALDMPEILEDFEQLLRRMTKR
jgi:predicted nucleotidyltransferase